MFTSSTDGSWGRQAAQYAIPPAAAAIAVVPVFYGFIAKNAQQTGKSIPRMGLKELFTRSRRAMLPTGTAIGLQVLTQKRIEDYLFGNKKLTFSESFVSSCIVGLLSTGPLAVLNGQSMTPPKTARESLRGLRQDKRQIVALVGRETGFLFALNICDPVRDRMKEVYGDTASVKYGSYFMSGVVGSLIGHPGDTTLALLQADLKIPNLRQFIYREAWRGAPVRALTVGSFSVCYKTLKEKMESFAK